MVRYLAKGRGRLCAMGLFAVQLFWNADLLAQTDKDFEAWQQKDQQIFQQFKDEHDRQFLEFLQKDWREWQGFQGEVVTQEQGEFEILEFSFFGWLTDTSHPMQPWRG